MFESSHYLQTMYNQPNIESPYQNDSLMRFHCMPAMVNYSYWVEFSCKPTGRQYIVIMLPELQ